MSTPAESLPGPRGTLRGGRIAEFRLETGILGIRGPVREYNVYGVKRVYLMF